MALTALIDGPHDGLVGDWLGHSVRCHCHTGRYHADLESGVVAYRWDGSHWTGQTQLFPTLTDRPAPPPLSLADLDRAMRDLYQPAITRLLITWPAFLPMPADPNPFPRFRLWR